MKSILKTSLLLLISLTAGAQVYTVESVPNTKLVNNSYVSDPTHILNDTTVARINQLLDSLEAKATAQVAVVLLPSIGEADRFEFAQKLFEKWGIGQSEKDNGLLILFILDQRNIRFHTGLGLEGLLPDARCKQIQRESMVPSFKEGDYNTGMLLGIERVATILTTREAIDEISANEEVAEDRDLYESITMAHLLFLVIMFLIALSNDKFDRPGSAPKVVITKTRWILLYGILPIALRYTAYQLDLSYGVFFLLAYALIIFFFLERYHRIYTTISKPFIEKKNYQALHNFYQDHDGYWLVAAIFFLIPMMFVYQAYRKKRTEFRNSPRPCKKCGTLTEKMSEQTEDEFLQAGQIMEEKIGVIDYDVWKCNSCGSTEILGYPSNKTTHYTRCPKCNYQTYHFGSRRTVLEATYTSEGKGEEERSCKNCGHHHIDTFVIAMLVAAATSSSSDSDSSSSDSSSDSGGDWGGGDSGGGGADSSW